MRIVALEEHFATAEVITAWRNVEPRWQDLSLQMATSNGIERRLTDLGDERVAAMDAAGIDRSILSLTAPGLHNLERRDAVALQEPTNDVLAEAVHTHRERFGGFATLAMPDPGAAAAELDRAITQLGFDGAMVFSHTRERSLDDPANWAVFEAAEALCAPLYLHPQSPPPDVRAAYYRGVGEHADRALATFGIGWHYDAGLALLRMILAGVFDRFPQLQVMLGHWGEVVLFYLDRIDNLHAAIRTARPISDYFRTNVYVTPGGIFSQRYLTWALQVIGAERIMFACDYPFAPPPPGGCEEFLIAAGLTGRDREQIASGNWEKLVAGIRR